jgi:photosystem II stability/assembly factor-like uncharacterized protein
MVFRILWYFQDRLAQPRPINPLRNNGTTGIHWSYLLVIVACLSMPAAAQQDAWQPIGPFGGVSRFLVGGPPGFVYASFENTGLFRSSNEGESWHSVMDGITDTEILSFCSTPDGRILCGGYGTIYESTNQGENWVKIADPSRIGSGDVRAIAVNPAGHIFFVSDWTNTLFRSTDHGTSWQAICGFPPWGGVGMGTTLRIASDSSLIVGTEGAGIFQVERDSIRAVPISYNLPSATAGAFPYWSTSGFEILDNGSIVLPYYPRLYFLSTGAPQWVRSAGYFSSTTLLRTDDSTLYAFGWSPVFLSTDRGSSWTAITDSTQSLPFQYLVKTSRGAFLAGQFRAGLQRSIDSMRTWMPSDKGIVRTDINCVFVTPLHAILAGTAHGGVFRTSDGGKTWTAPVLPGPAGGNDYIVDIRGDSRGALYAASMMHSLWRSLDDGNTWRETAFSDSLIMHGIDLRVTDLKISPNGELLVSGFVWFCDSLSGVYRSMDQGLTWERVLTSPEGSGAQSFLFLSDSVVLAGSRDKGFFRTNDFGKTWVTTTGVFPSITSMVVDSAQVLIAASMGSGVIRSTDFGISWAQSNDGLGNLVVRAVKVLPGSILFAGTDAGGYTSTDHGVTWNSVASSEFGGVRSAFKDNNGDVYLVTDAGLYRGLLPTSVWEARGDRSAGGTFLFSNYPNPFNPGTTIKFELRKPSDVRLSVFDMLGREVSVLVNERREAGVHEVRFDASKLASGVYFYRLHAGDFTQTKRLLRLK